MGYVYAEENITRQDSTTELDIITSKYGRS
jgi:hypothetical protein